MIRRAFLKVLLAVGTLPALRPLSGIMPEELVMKYRQPGISRGVDCMKCGRPTRTVVPVFKALRVSCGPTDLLPDPPSYEQWCPACADAVRSPTP